MKVWLDKNLPKRLKKDSPQAAIYTGRDEGWNDKKNNELLRLLLEEGYQC